MSTKYPNEATLGKHPTQRRGTVLLTFIVAIVASLADQSAAQGQEIFRDGFEMGNTCAWSVSRSDLEADFSAYTDPFVESVLKAETTCGNLEYYGEKDAAGHTTAITEVLYDTGSVLSKISVDAVGRPVRITDFSGGTTFEITWTSSSELVVSALSADGSLQATVAVDLNNPTAATPLTPVPASQPRALGEQNLLPREGVPVKLVAPPLAMERQYAVFNKDSFPSTVFIERCGSPVENASTLISMTSNGSQEFFPGTQVAPGQYLHTLPGQNSTTGDTLENICTSIAGVIGTSCTWFIEPVFQSGAVPIICSTIAAAIDLAAGGPTGEGALIFKGCVAGFTGAELYCKTAGASPAPGAPSIQDVVCQNISEAINLLPGPNVNLSAQAIVPGYGSITASAVAPASGPFPDFSLSVPGEVDVASLSVSPPDPAPYESYVVTADIVCAPLNTLVQVSISGTDGYFDLVSCTITGDDSCALYVPGAEAGIVDTLTTYIDGQAVRSTIIVF